MNESDRQKLFDKIDVGVRKGIAQTIEEYVEVVFLGAGSAKDAGYPLTAELLKVLEEFARNSPDNQLKKDWKLFEDFKRENCNSLIGTILDSDNPEHILTIHDLLIESLSEKDKYNCYKVWEDLNQVEDEKKIEEIWKKYLPDKKNLWKMERIKESLVRLIDDFFINKHYEDHRRIKEFPGYLEKVLASCEVVITTNWDTRAERTLMNLGKWSPHDGYGFDVPIQYVGFNRKSTKPERPTLNPSLVKVLKLHGSIGWHSTDEGIYLRSAGYLQYLRPPAAQRDICDSNAPPDGSGPDKDPMIITPSYLKSFDSPVLETISGQASEALNKASKVTFVGYSLPQGDKAIRGLLNPLKKRIKDKKVQVKVIVGKNCGREIISRWQQFFGNNIEIIRENASDYFK